MNLLSHVACLPSVQMYTNNFHLKRRDSEIIQMYSHAMHDGKAYSHVLGKPHLRFGEYNTNIHRKTVGIPQSARILLLLPRCGDDFINVVIVNYYLRAYRTRFINICMWECRHLSVIYQLSNRYYYCIIKSCIQYTETPAAKMFLAYELILIC